MNSISLSSQTGEVQQGWLGVLDAVGRLGMHGVAERSNIWASAVIFASATKEETGAILHVM